MLRLVLPKGSLERQTFELFSDADLALHRSSDADYRATIEDSRIAEVRILRPQEIARYVADGLFDLGITGRDWIEEPGADVVSLGELRYNKATGSPIRIVLAVASESPVTRVEDLPDGVRVSTEYPELTRRHLEKHGVRGEILLSYGATEGKVPEIADAIVELTETGQALLANGLRILDTIVVSCPELIANPQSYDDEPKRMAMHQIHTLLSGVLEARGKVLLKLNVSEADLPRVIGVLPAMKSPTVSQLSGGTGYAVETVVAKSDVNRLLPALKDHGATDIIELPISKIVH